MKCSIKELRSKYSLNQSQLAEKMGVTPSTISKWERNPKSITLDNARKLAKYFKVKIDDIKID